MIITIVTSIIVVLGTVSYAFYQTAINGRVSGTIAKWSFTANNQTDSFDLNLGELYPGKSGTYNITLSATNSDLDVYYELIFTLANINGFMYWDSSYTKPLGSYDGSYVGKSPRTCAREHERNIFCFHSALIFRQIYEIFSILPRTALEPAFFECVLSSGSRFLLIPDFLARPKNLLPGKTRVQLVQLL